MDLGRSPLQPWSGEQIGDPEDIENVLRHHLCGWRLELFRIEELGMVSEIGEGREEFRRRALGLLRPNVQATVAAKEGNASPNGGADTDGRTVQLAREMARMAGSIETWECPDPTAAVRRAEIGTLWVAPGVDLQPPRYRSLML